MQSLRYGGGAAEIPHPLGNVPLSQHLYVFSNLEAELGTSETPMEASSHRQHQLSTQSPAPLPFLEDGGVELKFPCF